MKRFVASLALLLLAAAPLFAQTKPEVVLLRVSPAEVPQPSLKYRLFPDRGQLTEGNAPTQYYRGLSFFVENSALLGELRSDYWDNWATMPLKDLPRKEMNEKLGMARNFLREFEIGSKRKRCDWQVEGRQEGFGLLIPDVQGFRLVSRPLAARARLAIAEGRYDEACATFQTGYALAHHLGQGPTLIHVLVGMRIARDMTEQVEALVQQPDAPNLYWSLAVMPRPFADLEPALQEEKVVIENMLPWLKKLDATPMTEAQVKECEAVTQNFGLRRATVGDRANRALALTEASAEGKLALVKRYGFTADQVAAMPGFQVAAMFAARDYRESLEEVVKWRHVPEGWKSAEYKEAQKRYGKALKRLDDLFFRRLLGALAGGEFPLEKVWLWAARVDRHLAALRTVEAIRQYAAKHEGQLPAKLANVKELPVPPDPLTGKPFEYLVEGDKATLYLEKSDEEKPKPVLTYYVEMKREKKCRGRHGRCLETVTSIPS
jgi:hypothetical protein